MFSRLQPYSEYKDSELPRIERLPIDWGESRLRSVAQMRVSSIDKLSREDEVPVRLCNYIDVYRHEFISERPGYMSATASPAEYVKFRLLIGDVLITKDSEVWNDIGVPALVVDGADSLVSGYHLALLRSRKEALTGEYLLRVLQTPAIVAQLHVSATGVTRFGLSQDDIKSIELPVPSLSEQAEITKFLRHVNARIDRVVATKRKMVALLEEQKSVYASQSITRGFDVRRAIRDSGIAWIGAIPEDWGLWAIGRLARIGNGSTPSRSEMGYWEGGDYPWLNSSQVNRGTVGSANQFVTPAALAKCHLPIVPPGSVLVAITGQGKTRGMCALLQTEATISQHIAFVSPDNRKILSRYLHAALTAAYVELRRISEASGSTKGALTCDDLKRFKIPLPPISEQNEIVSRIDAETELNRRAVVRAMHEIELLREFRTRLTSDVVTGQLDVRSAAAKLPDLDAAALATAEIDDSDDLDAVVEEFLDEDEP
ncbi:MAG: restriction endonuclease subunit S [Actinobacteria bacterium]|nr:restriction endonuclease subunit S [Actinomycetota bacterium]